MGDILKVRDIFEGTYIDIEEKLEMDFIMEHIQQSQNYWDIFNNLCRQARITQDTEQKIGFIQDAIKIYDESKKWHSKSKGGKIYFKNRWEKFKWIDGLKEDLQFQLKARDEIIPWILENAQNGFAQSAIYRAFPDDNQSSLRKIIGNLAEKTLIVRIKKGSSYYISTD